MAEDDKVESIETMADDSPEAIDEKALAQSVMEKAEKFARPFTDQEWDQIIDAISKNLPKFTQALGKTQYLDTLLVTTWIASAILVQKPDLQEDFFRFLTHFGECQGQTLIKLAEANPKLVLDSREKDTPIIIVPSLPQHIDLGVDNKGSKLIN